MGAIQKELKELRWYWSKNDREIQELKEVVDGLMDTIKQIAKNQACGR